MPPSDDSEDEQISPFIFGAVKNGLSSTFFKFLDTYATVITLQNGSNSIPTIPQSCGGALVPCLGRKKDWPPSHRTAGSSITNLQASTNKDAATAYLKKAVFDLVSDLPTEKPKNVRKWLILERHCFMPHYRPTPASERLAEATVVPGQIINLTPKELDWYLKSWVFYATGLQNLKAKSSSSRGLHVSGLA
uniref:Uncharacterized protein n=1 Tax=Moniliophthora roreri TaxID=221103 RepID=A0A0W0F2E1_MONRR